MVQTAVDAGATLINIQAEVKLLTPEEFANIFELPSSDVTSDHKVVFGVHCHDANGNGNTLTAIKHGAGRVPGGLSMESVNGLGNVALEEVAVA